MSRIGPRTIGGTSSITRRSPRSWAGRQRSGSEKDSGTPSAGTRSIVRGGSRRRRAASRTRTRRRGPPRPRLGRGGDRLVRAPLGDEVVRVEQRVDGFAAVCPVASQTFVPQLPLLEIAIVDVRDLELAAARRH